MIRNRSIEFCGLRIFAERNITCVTGRVEFPYEVGGDLVGADQAHREGKRITGRTECAINYQSK